MIIAQTNHLMLRSNEFIIYKNMECEGRSKSSNGWCEYVIRTKYKYHTLYLELIYE